MKRKRDSSAAATSAANDLYSIRWHTIANPATPSIDIMSSPDPLNDETTTIALPSSARRVTRSQQSNRFLSLASSPRKQTFELEVGDNTSPQRLLVTVETENGRPETATRRKLFPSSSPFRMTRPGIGATTTTTVPLRQSIEEDFGNNTPDLMATPRRRGRPRKTNGTPMPSAAKKRKAGTPLKQRTPRRQSTVHEPDPLSDPVAEPTPTPRKRGRPPKRATVDPSSEAGIESATKTTSVKSGRRRRQAFIPEELVEMVAEVAEAEEEPLPQPEEAPNDDDVDLIVAPSEANGDEPMPETATTAEAAANVQVSAEPDSDLDIWMNTIPSERTPRARTRSAEVDQPVVDVPDTRRSPSVGFESIASQNDDYAEAPSPSPEIDDAPENSIPDTGDTIAHGEDFSMILKESVRSFQDFKSSIPGPPRPLPDIEDELDQEASLIINRTLESLRHGPTEEHEENVEVEEIQNSPERSGEDGSDQEGEYAEQGVAEEDDVEEVPLQDELEPPQQVESQRRGSFGDDDVEMQDEFEQTVLEPAEEVADEDVGEHYENESAVAQSSPAVMPIAQQVDELASDQTAPIFSPAARSSPRSLLSARWARTPKRPNISPLRQRLLKSQVKQLDTAPSVTQGQDSIVEDSPSVRRSPARNHVPVINEEGYDDSFSEIPQDVLEAATPRQPGRAPPPPSDDEDEVDQIDFDEELSEQDVLEEVQEHVEQEMAGQQDESDQKQEQPLAQDEFESEPQPRQLPLPSNASSTAQTDNGRLPTPDDTPPNLDIDDSDAADKSVNEATYTSPTAPGKSVEQHFSSSPAHRSELTEELMDVSPAAPHIQVQDEHEAALEMPELLEQHPPSTAIPAISIEITPVNQLSSPAQEPQSVTLESPQERAARPALSAIVRAGRALQTVTSDPPSPEPRENQLGSPFRSSASKESWSGSREGATSRHSNLISPTRRSIGHRRQSASLDLLQDDPFTSTSRNTGQSSFMQALGWSMNQRESPTIAHASSQGSVASSLRITPPDDEMSWVAIEGPISPRLRGDNSLREAAGLPDVPIVQDVATQAEPEVELSSEGEHVDEKSQQDDETDIWEMEAERSALEIVSQEQQQTEKEPRPASQQHLRETMRSQPPRQQSAERKNSLVVLENQTVTAPSESASSPAAESGEADEFSLLVQNQKEAEAPQAPISATKAGRFDLSSFFSSPAAIPGMLADKLLSSKAAFGKSMAGAAANARAQQPAPAMATSSMFPQVSQKQFRPQSEDRTDLFSPFKSSTVTSQQRASSAPASQERPQTRNDSRPNLFSPSKSSIPSSQQRAEAVARSSSPTTPERIQMPIVAQKKDFTPRPRQASQSFFQPASTVPTPPRMQLSHADIQRWQQETSNASEDSPGPSRSLLRPLPPRNASPTKSSLRSPLKPHTPGRVVEFTSSVLSPMEQARARQERRLSNASSLGRDTSHNLSVAEAGETSIVDDKENQDSDVSMSEASPITKSHLAPAASAQASRASSSTAALSQTTWTRQHWLFMERILKRRQEGEFDADFPRCADKYLGKKVKSRGEVMVLQRWHLDCVDAFQAVVGGWDEGDLAKRLFSLISAEERRSQRGNLPSTSAATSRVMFH